MKWFIYKGQCNCSVTEHDIIKMLMVRINICWWGIHLQAKLNILNYSLLIWNNPIFILIFLQIQSLYTANLTMPLMCYYVLLILLSTQKSQ